MVQVTNTLSRSIIYYVFWKFAKAQQARNEPTVTPQTEARHSTSSEQSIESLCLAHNTYEAKEQRIS